MKLLDWVIAKLTYFKQAAYLQAYEKNVHGGPAPVDWREREGIPSHNQWPWTAKNRGHRHIALVKGAVEQPSIWKVASKGKGLGVYVPTPEVDAAWGDDSWIHVEEQAPGLVLDGTSEEEIDQKLQEFLKKGVQHHE